LGEFAQDSRRASDDSFALLLFGIQGTFGPWFMGPW